VPPGPARVHRLGHEGHTAVRFAAPHPERITHLVTMGPSLGC